MPTNQKTGAPPWHMWGDTKPAKLSVFTPADFAGGNGVREEAQFARVAYARPETWSFILAATLTDYSGPNQDGVILRVSFDLSLGVGRSLITLPQVREFIWDFKGANMIGQCLWATSMLNRVATTGTLGPLGEFVPVPTSDNTPDMFVAQDIQAKAVAHLTAPIAPVGTVAVAVDISAFFAPTTHIRPEWFIHRFTGGEERGT